MMNTKGIVTTAVTLTILPCLLIFSGCEGLSAERSWSSSPRHYVGFDLGTSGVRISVLEAKQPSAISTSASNMLFEQVHSEAIPWKDNAHDDANMWIESVFSLLENAKKSLQTLENVQSICVSGTSASCLLIDGKNVGKPSRSPSRMYNYNVISSVTAQGMDPIHGVRA